MNSIPSGGIPPTPPPGGPRRPEGPDDSNNDGENLIKAEFEFDPYLMENYPEIAKQIADSINLIVPLKTDLLDILSDPNVKYSIAINSNLKPIIERFAGLKEPLNKYEFEREFAHLKDAAGYTGCCMGEKDNPKSKKAFFIVFFSSKIINSRNRFELMAEIIRQLTFSKEVHKLFNDHIDKGTPLNFTYPRLLLKADEAVIEVLEKIKGMLYPQIHNDLNHLITAVKASIKENTARISRTEN